MQCQDRHVYQELYEHRLQQSTERLERLRAATERTWWSGRPDFERALDDLRGRRNSALARLEDVRRAADDSWHNTRRHADATFDRLRRALDQLEDHFQRQALM